MNINKYIKNIWVAACILMGGTLFNSCTDELDGKSVINTGTEGINLTISVDGMREKVLTRVTSERKDKSEIHDLHIILASGDKDEDEILDVLSVENMEEGTYVIAIPRVKAEDSGGGETRAETGMAGLDGPMLVSLLEEVVSRYQMGTLFSPYNREMFIIFRFDRKIGKQELEEELSKNLSVIGGNAKQYINGKLIFGVSSSFTDLKDSRERYDEAKTAADLDFYDLDKEVYTLPEELPEPAPVSFSSDRFTGQEGLQIFTEELHMTCADARRRKAAAGRRTFPPLR